MSGLTCTCFSGKSPLGLPDCVPSFGKDTVLIVMNERAADGTYNQIALTDLVDGKLPESFVTAKLNHADPTKRWYMTSPFDIVDPVRAETIKEELGGIPKVVRQGNLTWTGTMTAPPAYLKALQTHACGTNKVFFTVDAVGNLKGKKVEDENGDYVFRGRRIQGTTWDNVYNEGTKDEIQKIMLSFMVAETENDAEFTFLSVDSMSFSFHSLPKISVTVLKQVGDATSTTVVLTASTQFGSFGAETHVPGLGDTDFDVYNDTDDASVSVTVVEDENAKTYELTFADSTGDTLLITVDKDWYYSETLTVQIPT